MRRQTQHALLFLLGGALLRIAADDTYLRYVRAGHRWLLIGAGVVMVVLAVVAVVRDARSRSAEHLGGTAGGEGHEHAHGAVERHVPWLLLAPVLVLALVAPPALGADAVARGGVSAAAAPPAGATATGRAGLAPLPGGPAVISVVELVKRAVWERGSMDGREVVLVGFTVPDDRVPDQPRVQLARLSIFCCAADARISKVDLTGPAADGLAALPSDTWLEVRGVVEPGSAAGRADVVPAVVVGDVRTVPAPADPYQD